MSPTTFLVDAVSSLWSNSLLIPVIVLLLFCLLAGYLVLSGIFTPITVGTKVPPYGKMTIAYKANTGPYKNSAFMYEELDKLLPENVPRVFVGIFYDDPESVPENELRYAVGYLLGSGDEDLINVANVLDKLLCNGYKMAFLPKQDYAVMATFPLRTTLSMYMAIFRVYPKLRNYINRMGLCAYPAVEICTLDEIHFMMPLFKQEEFFVLEFSEEQVSVATTEVSYRDLPADHTPVDDMAADGPSSRNSDRRSDEGDRQRRSVSKPVDDENRGPLHHVDSGDNVFVKPTKPAPKKVKQVLSEELSHSNSSSKDSSENSSFEDLKDEKFEDADETDSEFCIDGQK